MDDTYGSEYPGENLENEVLGHSFLSFPVGIRGDAQVTAAFQDRWLGDASANGCQHNLNTSCLDQPKKGGWEKWKRHLKRFQSNLDDFSAIDWLCLISSVAASLTRQPL
jgi:hypothetical protein